MGLILGIDRSYGWVFEGGSKNGAHLIWPQPVMTPARFGKATGSKIDVASTHESEYYFREDSFDPISRIRRGRIYKASGTTDSWHVINPQSVRLVGSSSMANDRWIDMILAEYLPYRISIEQQRDESQLSIALGTVTAFSIWHIVNVETTITGEHFLTMKARQSFGAFPIVDWGLVPDTTGLVQEMLDKLLDDVYRAVPESVVDRSREAATAILSAYLQSQGIPQANGKDLGKR